MAAALLAPQDAVSATFNVTSSFCGSGAGTLSQAVRDANASFGPDVIEIAAGLLIQDNCDMDVLPDDSGLLVTESVTIQGNGSKVHGRNYYIEKSSGNVNRLNTGGKCPGSSPDYLPAGESDSLFQIGARNVDNTGIDVVIEDLNVENVSQVAAVRNNASLTIRNMEALDIRDMQQCSRPAIQGFGGADVTLEELTIERSTAFRTVVPSGVILVSDGDLEIYNSHFELNPSRYAVEVGSGTADIVSSQFENSGAVFQAGSGTTRVINSLFRPATISPSRRYSDGFLAQAGGTISLQASTVLYHVVECPPFPSLDCDWTGQLPSLAAFQAVNASIQLSESVIHVQSTNPVLNPSSTLLLEEVGTGDIRADDQSFIQPVDWQNTAALEAITTPPTALIAGPDTLPVDPVGLAFQSIFFPDSVTPIITGAAALVDVISNAGTGEANELLDGRGNPIAKDVLGAPRTIASLRNVGAVQNDLVPVLLALIDESTPFTARLFWNQPRSAGITGYDLCQGSGTPPALDRTLNACTATLTEGVTNSAPATVATVPNLPPNNENHWFFVRAVAGVNKEPWSKVQNVVVPVTITYPSIAQVGSMTQIDPVVTGPLSGANFLLLSGSLPGGLTLNPTTGAITGDLTGTCTPGTLGILIITGTGATTTSATTLGCPPVPAEAIPTLPSWHLLLLCLMLALYIGFVSTPGHMSRHLC